MVAPTVSPLPGASSLEVGKPSYQAHQTGLKPACSFDPAVLLEVVVGAEHEGEDDATRLGECLRRGVEDAGSTSRCRRSPGDAANPDGSAGRTR